MSNIEYTTSNFLLYGLTQVDIQTWNDSEDWVEKISGVGWNDETPKRIIKFEINKAVGGTYYDLSPFTELEDMHCITVRSGSKSLPVQYNLSQNVNIKRLEISGTLSNFSFTANSFTNLTKIEYLSVKEYAGPNPENLPLLKEFGTNLDASGIDFSKNPLLEKISLGRSPFTPVYTKKIDLSQNNNLIEVNLLEINLEELILPSTPTLQKVSCTYNRLKFSTLPLLNINEYSYSPQINDDPLTLGIGEEFDLSSEHLIDGVTTQYTYVDNGTQTSITSGITNNGGIITVTDASYIGKTINCSLTNARFPGLKLTYPLKIVVGATGIKENTETNTITLKSPTIRQGDLLTICSTIEETGVFFLFSNSGQAICSGIIKNGDNEIATPLMQGGYVLNIKTDSGINYSFKIVVL